MARAPAVRTLPFVLASLGLLAGAAAASPRQDHLIPRDKLMHLGLSAAIGASTAAAARNHGFSECAAARAGVSIVLVFGTAKEVHDRRPGGSGWSWSDMAWNLIGGALGSLAVTGCG